MGPFFSKLAQYLSRHGCEVGKINFNAGDALFYRFPGATAYTGRHEDLSEWLAAHIQTHRYEAIALFGQSRPVHQIARKVARELGLAVHVFEEGYVRPDFVTLEEGGVNALSPLPRDGAFYRALPATPAHTAQEVTGQRFRRTALIASIYSVAMLLGYARYRHHVYHRPINPVSQAWRWGVVGGLRKLRAYVTDRPLMRQLLAAHNHKRYFLLPLQVHNDSQMVNHSPFANSEAMICHVLESFARAADKQDLLVIKHHPMDRPYRLYHQVIRQHARRLGVQDRVLIAQDLHLPSVLEHAKGLVTVNSTTGLQALLHNTPVAVLGDCIYNVDGLVYGPSLPLDAFWRSPGKVDKVLFRAYQRYLIQHSQLNASFYADTPCLRP
ncbi:capsule biosynthesis protein [Lampropedia cohaerens]|nr:capsular biosynthesis protein [Lampropedia cohaerens]